MIVKSYPKSKPRQQYCPLNVNCFNNCGTLHSKDRWRVPKINMPVGAFNVSVLDVLEEINLGCHSLILL
jgi:hypothetical protein